MKTNTNIPLNSRVALVTMIGLRRFWIERCVPPHPNPLPRGEGIERPAHRLIRHARLVEVRRRILALPKEEGWGEEKGRTVDPMGLTRHAFRASPCRRIFSAFRAVIRIIALLVWAPLGADPLIRSSLAAEGEIPVRLGTILPSGTAQYRILQEMGEKWRKASDETVKLTIFPDGRLGGEAEMVRKMRIKQINACLLSVVGLQEIDPAVSGLQVMPMMFRSWAEVDYVRERMRPMLEQRLRTKGFEVLFWADAGWVKFFSKTAATRPDEFKKFKMFVWAGDVPQTELMKSMGYRPVALETTDILLGLRTDLINAVPVPPLIALAGQMYGPASHMLDLNWVPIVGAAVIREEVWEKFPPATQITFRQAADAAGEKIRARGRFESEESVRVMQERGLKVHSPSAEIEAEWRKLAERVHPQIRGSMVPSDIFDEVQRHLKEYRATKAVANR